MYFPHLISSWDSWRLTGTGSLPGDSEDIQLQRVWRPSQGGATCTHGWHSRDSPAGFLIQDPHTTDTVRFLIGNLDLAASHPAAGVSHIRTVVFSLSESAQITTSFDSRGGSAESSLLLTEQIMLHFSSSLKSRSPACPMLAYFRSLWSPVCKTI